MSVTNNDDSETKDATYENFEEWDGCTVNQSYADLDPGDIGFTRSADLTNDPNGKSFSATIKACSEPGLAGTCSEKTLTFIKDFDGNLFEIVRSAQPKDRSSATN